MLYKLRDCFRKPQFDNSTIWQFDNGHLRSKNCGIASGELQFGNSIIWQFDKTDFFPGVANADFNKNNLWPVQEDIFCYKFKTGV
jgi:hypothetical protein